MKKSLVLLGMMGVGKTTIAKIVAEKLNLKLVDIDTEIETKNLMPIKEIFENKGENFFRTEEEKIALNYIPENNCVIALGGGAFINKKIREKVLSCSISIWLDADIKLLKTRLKNSNKRPLLKKNNIKGKIEEIYKNRRDTYNLANYKIVCDKLSLKKISEKILDIYENQ